MQLRERKDSNCVGILSDQEELETTSNFSEYTIHVNVNVNDILNYRPIHHMNIRDSMMTNWSIMAARAQMEQVRPQEFSLKNMKSTED